AALDALLRVGEFTVEDILTELPRLKGHRWVTHLRELAPLADGRSESPAESRTRLLLLDAGLPAPELQWSVLNVAGVAIYRLDLAYPKLLLAIEYDGQEFHSSVEQQEHDRKRRSRLRRMGWTIVVLTSDDVYGADPQAATKVRRALRNLTRLGISA
ncbi:MAG: endonuclease domain-containing protein, partial [Nocardioidaceae bacterium]